LSLATAAPMRKSSSGERGRDLLSTVILPGGSSPTTAGADTHHSESVRESTMIARVMTKSTSFDEFHDLLSRRILLLDGAMGSMIHRFNPTEQDYRGDRFVDHAIDLKNASDVLCLTQPAMIESIHRQYLEAGSDIIETNTFNGNIISMEEFGLAREVREINETGARLARRCADEFTEKNPDKPRFVA